MVVVSGTHAPILESSSLNCSYLNALKWVLVRHFIDSSPPIFNFSSATRSRYWKWRDHSESKRPLQSEWGMPAPIVVLGPTFLISIQIIVVCILCKLGAHCRLLANFQWSLLSQAKLELCSSKPLQQFTSLNSLFSQRNSFYISRTIAYGCRQ